MPRGGCEQIVGSFCSALGHLLRLEAKCKSFTFEYPNPIEFAWSQWEWMKWIGYVIYRTIVALFMMTALLIEIPFTLQENKNSNYFIWLTFATNISLMFSTFTLVGFSIYSIYYSIRRDQKPGVHGNKVLWFFYTVFTNCMIVTSGVYWIASWDGGNTIIQTDEFLRLSSKLKHSIPSAIIILDLCLNNMPVRLLHFIYPCLLGVLYTIFSYVYWVADLPGISDNGIIYPALNWNKPASTALSCLLSLLFCMCIQIFLFWIYFIRSFLSCKLGGRGGSLLIQSYIDKDSTAPDDGNTFSLFEAPDSEMNVGCTYHTMD